MRAFINTVVYLLFVLVIFPGWIYSQGTPDDIVHMTSLPRNLVAPLRVAVDGEGITYICDASKKSISKYDASGNFLEEINVVPSPVSVAINTEDQLYIGDAETGQIFKYDEALGATEFYQGTLYPSSMEFSPGNTLYITDSKLQQVIVLDISGNLIHTFGSDILDLPTGIAIDNQNKRILVGEHGGKGTGFKPVVKVWMFDFEGDLIKSFGSHGSGDGQFYRVQGLSIGKCGNIYVVDPYQSRISIFDKDGVFITKFGEYGFQAGHLNIPMDIEFDAQERLLVTSMNNGRLEVFSITDTLPCSNILSVNKMICSGDSTDIEIAFTGTAPWTFTYSINGVDTATITTPDNPYILTVSDSGHYEVTALSDANYSGTCFTGSADVIVSDTTPTSDMIGDTIICSGESTDISISFTGSAPWRFTYTLDGVNPSTVATTNNPYIFSVSEAGLYKVESLTGGGCTGTSFSGSADVSVKPRPSALLTDGNVQIVIDTNETANLSVALTGTPPWTLTYTIDDLNPTTLSNITQNPYILTSSYIGTYDIKEASDAWCNNTVSLGYPELVLKSSIAPPSSQMIGGESFICPGESVPLSIQLTGSAPWTFSYMVDTLMTTTIFNTYTNPYIINAIYGGTYEVVALSDSYYQVTDFSGNAVVSMNPLPVPEFNYTSDNLDVSFFNTSLDADTYSWNFGDGNTSIEMNPVHHFQIPGQYQISLTVSNPQCGERTLNRTIDVSDASLVKSDIENHLKIYPNPAEGMVTIEIKNAVDSEMTMEIIGVGGQVIYSNIFHSRSIIEEINLSSFAGGMYFVKIVSNESICLKKLIISNTNRP
ncbi:T9SS type A sorting domain-containing protein [Bacteroidota bacterium]